MTDVMAHLSGVGVPQQLDTKIVQRTWSKFLDRTYEESFICSPYFSIQSILLYLFFPQLLEVLFLMMQ